MIVWFFDMCFSLLSFRLCSQAKLDSYKKLVDEGKSLNDDQKVRYLAAYFSDNEAVNVAESARRVKDLHRAVQVSGSFTDISSDVVSQILCNSINVLSVTESLDGQ